MPFEWATTATAASALADTGTCGAYVRELERRPPLEGHLSRAHGFLQPQPTAERLPASHRAWDQAAAELPALFASNRAQRELAALPVLSATVDALPDEDLTRASVVLSALAHAYWRFGADRFFPQRITQVPTDLPASIAVPWRELALRLGRTDPERPFQNFYDLFLANYRLAPHAAADAPRIIENLEVLVPSFGNAAERIFYMSFVEMHYHFAPVVGALCDLDAAVRADETPRATSALEVIVTSLGRATSVWNKISPRKNSALYCDPVLWSKTAAILGVPPSGCSQGATSGACAPMLFLMDALLERTGYASHYGQFMQERASAMLAFSVHELARRVRRIGLRDFIAERAGTSEGKALAAAYDVVLEGYAGRGGWLDRHAAKVFNFLCISTVTGRNASVSGDERYFERQTWVSASAELHESRNERALTCPHAESAVIAKPPARPARTALDAELPVYSRATVARHHLAGDAWLIIDDVVYDVSTYTDKHPGGDALLRVYAGQDVSEVFWAQTVHWTAKQSLLLRSLSIGRVPPKDARQERLFAALYSLLRARQALLLQYEHSMQNVALKLFSDENAHMMFWRENLPAAYEAMAPGGWQEIAAEPALVQLLAEAQDLSRRYDLRGELEPAIARALVRRSQSLAKWDGALADALIAETIERIERTDSARDAGTAHTELARASRSLLLAHLREHPTLLLSDIASRRP